MTVLRAPEEFRELAAPLAMRPDQDMWEPYVQAVRAHVPEAATKIVFDRYHIMTHMGKAVDDVRKREHRALRAAGDDPLSGSKSLWLYAAENLPKQHRERFAQLKATLNSARESWHHLQRLIPGQSSVG